jgi:hypothetical protein
MGGKPARKIICHLAPAAEKSATCQIKEIGNGFPLDTQPEFGASPAYIRAKTQAFKNWVLPQCPKISGGKHWEAVVDGC